MRSWLTTMYSGIFENTTGSKPTKEEREFLSKFFDVYTESQGKQIYYDGIFHFKRWVPQPIIYLTIKLKVLYHFKKLEAPHSLILLHQQFAKQTFESAKRKYSKVD